MKITIYEVSGKTYLIYYNKNFHYKYHKKPTLLNISLCWMITKLRILLKGKNE